MTRPTVRIHNVSANEIINREMNDAEFAQYEIDQAAATAETAAEATKAAQKQAVLDRLGLTAEEASLLLGGN
jgi:hypothetical protein